MPGLTIVGLGPAGTDRLRPAVLALLEDPRHRLLLRTAEHPAAAELAAGRRAETADHLYESADDFDTLYEAVARWVLAAARDDDVVYAVPGSALVGERTVRTVTELAAAEGIAVEVFPGESFLDLVLARTGVDPLRDGLQVLDGRALPDPLNLSLPTVIGQVDTPLVMADVQVRLGRTLAEGVPITVLIDLGDDAERVVEVPIEELDTAPAGPRVSLYVSPRDAGLSGVIATVRTLRRECPWDREQTHHSLITYLVEEAYEAIEALSTLPPDAPAEPDFGAYAEVEEELGDLLVQVLLHSTLASEAGAFDIDEVAEGLRRKLVHRHPHVYGDDDADDAAWVVGRWERLKKEEKARQSVLDGVPASLPALARAAKFQTRAASVGFDWPEAAPVVDKIVEEAGELRHDLGDPHRAAEELGDLLFSVVNVARHLGIDPELALRRAADRFEARFRAIEQGAAANGVELSDLTLEEMDALWDRAKGAAD